MSTSIGSIKLDTKRLDEIARKLGTNADSAVKSIAFQLQAETQHNIQSKHVWDTGAYHGSWMAEPIREAFWWVHDGVDYGIYLELGTYKMAARPCLTPAAESVAKQIGAIFEKELFK
jgi:hypothetical protein